MTCLRRLDAYVRDKNMAYIFLSMPIAKIIHVAELVDMYFDICCTLILPLSRLYGLIHVAAVAHNNTTESK